MKHAYLNEKLKFKEYKEKVATIHEKKLESLELSYERKFTKYTNKIKMCLESQSFEECHTSALATWNSEPLRSDIHLNDRPKS
jgi:hypothetical protein